VPLERQNLPAKASWTGRFDTYRKDQIVFSQGEPADSIFYLQEGELKLTVASEQGKEAIVAFLGAGDFFGEGCLAGQPVRMATAAAVEECVVVPLTKLAVIRFIHD
jgi:CRP-like cAMP-binding protein